MYLFVSATEACQTKEAPTDQDYLINADFMIFAFEEDNFFKMNHNSKSVIGSSSASNILYITEDKEKCVGSLSDEELEDVRCGVHRAFKTFNGKFLQMDEDDDWVKVPVSQLGSCSEGDYHPM